MSHVGIIFKREFLGYFRSPVAYVVLACFHLLAMALTFFVGKFFDAGSASLERFFITIPWVCVLFAPATAMRLWAEEKRAGTIELLMTLPLSLRETVFGKFLAAWAFIITGIVLTVPIVFTVAYLGDPDWGAIFSGYLGCILLAGAYLGLCSFTSALTRNQVISFVLGALVCLIITFLGWSVFSGFLQSMVGVGFSDAMANMGSLSHFDSMTRGLVELRAIVYFLSLIIVSLLSTVVVLER